MRSLARTSLWLTAPLFACATFLLDATRAAACESDRECPGGACVEVGVKPCPPLYCQPGQECPKCEPVVVKECRVAETKCASDRDCADTEKCTAMPTSNCTTSSPTQPPKCPPDDLSCREPPPPPPCQPDDLNCQKPPPPMCETTTVDVCVPRFLLPCGVDADCGPHFTCEEQQICACAGGGGTPTQPPPMDPAVDGGSAPDDVADCKCASTGEKMCRLEEIPCQSDAQCPAPLHCVMPPVSRDIADCTPDKTGHLVCKPPMDAGVVVDGRCVPPGFGLPGGWETVLPGVPDKSVGGEEPPVDDGIDAGNDTSNKRDDGNRPLFVINCDQSSSSGAAGGLLLLAVAAWWPRRRRHGA